ncbi:hypothetical protein Vretifemale_6463 [Volvox reticuliferus]|uniref:Alpha-ketoglutarate-dependent dioxygenase AlkB-like domain-containing protein n=1 Tax=Volvox reticuliferus TaxID=1737510 RepID=A0A8J4CBE6_9CHLO|nr:hypothetical protein Vretifemale_6463 [Volvox reticuliferus]
MLDAALLYQQVALLCINLHLDLGCADELPLPRANPAAAGSTRDMRSRPSVLLIRQGKNPDSEPVQARKTVREEFDGRFHQAVHRGGGEAGVRHADGAENDIEIHKACVDNGDVSTAAVELSASHFGNSNEAVCVLELPGDLPSASAKAFVQPTAAALSVAKKASESKCSPMPSIARISLPGKLSGLMSAPKPSTNTTVASESLPSHQDFARCAITAPEASLCLILEPEVDGSVSSAMVAPLDGPLLSEVSWRAGVGGDTSTCATCGDGDARGRSVAVQDADPVHPTFLQRVVLWDGVRTCTRKGLAGVVQHVGVTTTTAATAAATTTVDSIVGDRHGTKEYHVTDCAAGGGDGEGPNGATSVMQQLGATHGATTPSGGENGVAAAVSKEEREQEREKLQHVSGTALVALSPHRFQAVPNPSLEGQYLVTEFITTAEEVELLTLCDDPVLKPAWSPWIGQTYSNATAQKTRGKRWGVLPDYHRRGVAPLEHPLPRLLQLLVKRMREHVGMLRTFQPNEANAIDYRRSRGSWLRPHVDDRILSGDLIVNLSLAGSAVMTFAKDKGRDGVRAGAIYYSGPSRAPDAGERVESQLQQRSRSPQRQQHTVGEIQVRLAPRSLQILSRAARYNYTHAIAPSDLLDERRVSITFRRSELRPFEKAAV